MLETMADEYAGRVTILQIDAEQAPIFTSQYGITGVPTLLFFQGGLIVDEIVGAPTLRLLREKLDWIAPATAPMKG